MAENNKKNTTAAYLIRVRGALDRRWSDWFDGFTMTFHNGDTELTGPVSDQAALHGVLAKIRDLGLAILLVERTEIKAESEEV